VNILDDSLRLIDALSGWGLRECVKYPEVQVPSDESHRTILGMEVVLRHVPELIARILLAEPLAPTEPRAVFRAEFGLEDVDKLLLHSGVALADYPSDEHVQRLVKSPDLSPIVCTVQVEKDEPDRLAGRFVIYDGWHRSAAWLIRARRGRPERLIAEVIKTKRPLMRLALSTKSPASR
jgi:hypothetical protein